MKLTYSELLEVTSHNRHFVQVYMPKDETPPERTAEEQEWLELLKRTAWFRKEDE